MVWAQGLESLDLDDLNSVICGVTGVLGNSGYFDSEPLRRWSNRSTIRTGFLIKNPAWITLDAAGYPLAKMWPIVKKTAKIINFKM